MLLKPIRKQEGASSRARVLAVCPGMGLGCQWEMSFRERLATWL